MQIFYLRKLSRYVKIIKRSLKGGIVTKSVTSEDVFTQNLLGLFYPPEEIYQCGIVYTPEGRSSIGSFLVSSEQSYSRVTIPYVTAEQLIRCLSQLSYSLIGLLVRDRIQEFPGADVETFKALMVGGRMWFRNLNLHFQSGVTKGQAFPLTVTLKSVRVIRGYAVCILMVHGAVRGTIEFVAPFHHSPVSSSTG